MKALVAKALADRVRDGEVIGIGSGSTVEMAVDQIAQRIAKEGISVSGIPTSLRTASHASEAGIQMLSPCTDTPITWAFDGADEVDDDFNMIKGRGAAMLNEKIIARRAKNLVIIVSEDKLVERLGSVHPIPVECIPEARYLVQRGLVDLGATEVVVRAASNKYGPVITEHNNVILDARFDSIPPELDQQIQSLTGVVETGLFLGFGQELLVATEKDVSSQRLVNGERKSEILSF